MERAVAETDPSAALPVGRLHSLLNIIKIIIHKLGHLIHIYLSKVLQILLCITASVSFLLDHREQVKNETILIYFFLYIVFGVLMSCVAVLCVAVAEARLHQPSEELASAGDSANTGLL